MVPFGSQVRVPHVSVRVQIEDRKIWIYSSARLHGTGGKGVLTTNHDRDLIVRNHASNHIPDPLDHQFRTAKVRLHLGKGVNAMVCWLATKLEVPQFHL